MSPKFILWKFALEFDKMSFQSAMTLMLFLAAFLSIEMFADECLAADIGSHVSKFTEPIFSLVGGLFGRKAKKEGPEIVIKNSQSPNREKNESNGIDDKETEDAKSVKHSEVNINKNERNTYDNNPKAEKVESNLENTNKSNK